MRQLNRAAQRGVGLIEGLVAIAVLGFGVLGLARFQADVFRQSTDAQNRLMAAGFADTLLAYVRVDAANAACYTWPQTGACGSSAASTLAADWAAGAAASGFDDVSATLATPSQLTARLAWSSHAFKEVRSLEATTDVRP